MLTLPDPTLLIQNVRNALDAVTATHLSARISNRAWFPSIASEIAERTKMAAAKLRVLCQRDTAAL